MQAPKEKKNEQMSLAHRKYFVNFIRSGGFVSIWNSEEPILQLADARNPSKWSGGLEH